MKNTQRQDACCTNHPPSSGPIAAVIDVKPDHVPMALAPLFGRKRSADQGEAAGYEQCSTNALQGARGDKLANVRRNATPRRSDGKEDDTSCKNLSPAVEVAQRTTSEE
jgi:hypothetical protein